MHRIELPQNKGCITHDESRRVILFCERITGQHDSEYGDVLERTIGEPDSSELQGSGNNRVLIALWYDATQYHFQCLSKQFARLE